VKLAVVVQRYGADISGGAELHARYIAERLGRHADVQVLTTCARDYVSWRNELPAGEERVNGIPVRRFPVARPRNPQDFGVRSRWVFEHAHSVSDELKWLRSEGPTSPALVRHIARIQHDVDFFIFFSYRYFHAYHGARAVPDKAVLVPTAERDPAIGLGIFVPLFRGVRAIVYNSLEERALIEAVSRRDGPGAVVGVGSDIPERPDPSRFRRAYNVRRPFAIYIGRIDANKGCAELFSHFERYAAACPNGLDLVLVGSRHLDIPAHPRVRHVGFLPDAEKFDALAAADLLIMPSEFESLSMVVLEAWALGKPVLVNGRCDVLRGQCLRSRAGLAYDSADEFVEALFVLEAAGPAGAILGRHGRDYFRRHYAWPVIEHRYREIFDRLAREAARRPMEPLPGPVARRRRTLPPARVVVDRAPRGPVIR
jgi:glycosyltransferase involved in cell wall biosynthesis